MWYSSSMSIQVDSGKISYTYKMQEGVISIRGEGEIVQFNFWCRPAPESFRLKNPFSYVGSVDYLPAASMITLWLRDYLTRMYGLGNYDTSKAGCRYWMVIMQMNQFYFPVWDYSSRNAMIVKESSSLILRQESSFCLSKVRINCLIS